MMEADHSVIDEPIFTAVNEGAVEKKEPTRKKKALSNRELDVLTYMKDGMKNPEIAEELSLSTKTVENHVRNILLKLGVKNRTQAVVEGLRSSIIVF